MGGFKLGPINIGKVLDTELKQGKSAITGDLRRSTMNVLGEGTGGLIGTPQSIPTQNDDGVQRRAESPRGRMSPQTEALLNRTGMGQQPQTPASTIGGFLDRTVNRIGAAILPSEATVQRVQHGVATTGATISGAATAVRGAVTDTPSQGLSENSPPQPEQPSLLQRIGNFFSGGGQRATAAVATSVAVAATPAPAIEEPQTPSIRASLTTPDDSIQPISAANLSLAPSATLQEMLTNLPPVVAAPTAAPASTVNTSSPVVTTSVTPREDFAAVAPATPPAAPAPTEPARRFDAATYERAAAYVNSMNPKV